MNKLIYFSLLLIFSVTFAYAKDKTKKEKKKSNTTLEATETTTQTKLSSKDIEENNLFFEAQKLKVLGDNKNAILAFEKVLSFNPSSHASMFELARLYYITKNDEKALKNIAMAVKLMPNNLWYNLVYAQVLSVKGDYKLANTVYDKIIELEPREQAYYYDKAGLLESIGDVNKSIDFYDEIESIFGIDPYAIDQKKRLYVSINKIDNAASEIQKLISIDSTNPDFYNELAALYISNKMNDKAYPIYQEILTKHPDYPPALLAMADYNYQHGNKDKAIGFTKAAFENSDLNIDIKMKILYQYIQFYKAKKNEINDAFILAEAVRKAHPKDAKAYAISGDLYYVDSDDSLALYYYEKSLEYKKDIFTVWQQTLFLCSDMKKYTLLKKYSEEAIELFPTQPLPYYFNGISMYQLDRYRDAVNVLQEAYKLANDNSVLRTQILASLGDNYHEIGNNIASDSCFEASLKLDPKNAYTLNNYAYFLSLRKDQLMKAKEYADMAIKIESTNPNYLDTYAWILFQLGEYVKAEEWQLNALRNSDLSDGTMFEHYGDILFKNNKLEEAVNAWKKAKEKGIKSILLDKKIADKTWYDEAKP